MLEGGAVADLLPADCEHQLSTSLRELTEYGVKPASAHESFLARSKLSHGAHEPGLPLWVRGQLVNAVTALLHVEYRTVAQGTQPSFDLSLTNAPD